MISTFISPSPSTPFDPPCGSSLTPGLSDLVGSDLLPVNLLHTEPVLGLAGA